MVVVDGGLTVVDVSLVVVAVFSRKLSGGRELYMLAL